MFDKITIEITKARVIQKFLDGKKTVLQITAFLDSHDNPNIYVMVNDKNFDALTRDEQQ